MERPQPDDAYYIVQCPRNQHCSKTNKHRGACNLRGRGEASLFVQFVALKTLPDEQRVSKRMLLAVNPEVKQLLESAKACYLQAADTYEESRGQGNKVNVLSARFEEEKAHTTQIHAELVAKAVLSVQQEYIYVMTRCDDPPALAHKISKFFLLSFRIQDGPEERAAASLAIRLSVVMKNTDFTKFCGTLIVGMENRAEAKVIAVETQKKLLLARNEKNRLKKKFTEFKAAAREYETRVDELMDATQMEPFANTQDFLQGSLGLDSESQDDSISAGGGRSSGGGSDGDDDGGGGSSFGSAAAEVSQVPQPFVQEANRPPATQRKRKTRWDVPTQDATNSFFGANKK